MNAMIPIQATAFARIRRFRNLRSGGSRDAIAGQSVRASVSDEARETGTLSMLPVVSSGTII